MPAHRRTSRLNTSWPWPSFDPSLLQCQTPVPFCFQTGIYLSFSPFSQRLICWSFAVESRHEEEPGPPEVDSSRDRCPTLFGNNLPSVCVLSVSSQLSLPLSSLVTQLAELWNQTSRGTEKPSSASLALLSLPLKAQSRSQGNNFSHQSCQKASLRLRWKWHAGTMFSSVSHLSLRRFSFLDKRI